MAIDPTSGSGVKPIITTTVTTTEGPTSSTTTGPKKPVEIVGDESATQSADLPGAPTGGVPVGTSGLAAVMSGALAPTSHAGLFDLLPGRYPDAVSLTTVMNQASKSPAGKAAIKQFIAQIEQKTGIKPNKALVSAAMANPARIADLLVATPQQMSAGIDALNVAYKAGKLPALPPMPADLPNKFDLADIGSAPKTRPEGELKELAPGLFQGDVKNASLSDGQAKSNMVVAEVLDRLAGNAEKAPKDRFQIKYAGGTFTRLETFLDRLAENGHKVEVNFEHRVANFANLKTKHPGTGQILDVPAAFVVKTGLKDAEGNEALLPSVHSEMVISITSGPETKGPKIDSKVKWYQGISGTGFFPCDLFTTPSWCGMKTTDTLTGDDALKAINIAGLTSDMINSSAEAQNLAVGGYGVTGVCNDSVAIVQHAMTGKTAAYPLLMRDHTVMKELVKRLSDKDKLDDPEYKQIRAAIQNLDSDTTPNASARDRAKAGGIVWTPGTEPFQHIVDARNILG